MIRRNLGHEVDSTGNHDEIKHFLCFIPSQMHPIPETMIEYIKKKILSLDDALNTGNHDRINQKSDSCLWMMHPVPETITSEAEKVILVFA
jgi:hypothetical protein